MASDSGLKVGDSFDDFNSLKWAIEVFEKSQKSNYWIRDCRTIEAAQKKGIKRPMKESLVYYNLTWACVKGGRNYDDSTRSPRGDCGSHVKVAVSKDGQTLLVKDVCTKHNHDTSQETFERLPKQKRLLKENTATKLKKVKQEKVQKNSVKKLIQRNLFKKVGKSVKIKKLNGNFNVAKRSLARPRSLQDFVENMRQSGDVVVEVLEDEKGNMKGIFWQDATMKSRFDTYPELVIVGSSTDLNKLKTSVVLQVIIDGNGESEVASVFLIASDDSETLTSLLNIFRNHNAAWLRTRTVLMSKDVKHNCVYRSCFPGACLNLCMLQVVQEMKRDLAEEKMSLSAVERLGVLSLLEKMARSQCGDAYDCLYDELQSTGLSKVMNYFNKKWHPQREEWVSGLKTSVHFKNETMQKVDAVFSKVKDMIKKSSPLPHFCQDLRKVLETLHRDMDTRNAGEIAGRSTEMHEQGSAEQRFASFLTPYAFSETLSELYKCRDVKMDAEICDLTSPISISTKAGEVKVSATCCSCQHFTTTWIPCQHIFAFRQKAGLDLFFEDIAQRWQLSVMKSVLPSQPKFLAPAYIIRSERQQKGPNFVQSSESTNSSFLFRKPQAAWTSFSSVHVNGQLSEMSQAQKFESLLVFTQRLAQLGSDVPMGKFVKRREMLTRLVEVWERGDDAEDDTVLSPSFSPNIHQDDLIVPGITNSTTNQSEPFQVHGSTAMPDNLHMKPFVAKQRTYVPYQQQDHSSHSMGVMEHIQQWPHIIL